jgi:predicted nucleic acid-binding protein
VQKYQWMTQEEVGAFLHDLATLTILASGTRLVRVIRDDPDDDYVLSAALETSAPYIVSGDQHLLDLSTYQSIHIVTPGEFLRLLGQPC